MEAHALALELRDGFVQLISLFFLGLSKANMGRMSEALAALTEALALAQRNGDHFFLPRLPNCIGWIYRELQDFDRAFKYDLQGVEIARADDVAEAEANSLINLGYNYTHTGEAEQARAAFRAVGACFARDDWNRWRYNLRLQAGAAEHWLAKGEVGQTEAYAQRLLEAATRHGVGKYIAVAHQLLAEVAVAREHLAEAEAELSAALDELRMHPVPILAWKTNAALGRLRLRMGQRDAARESFARASEVVEHIAANVSDEKLRATFLNSASVREILEHSDSHRS